LRRERRGRADRGGWGAIHGRKRRSARRCGALVGQRRRESTLRKHLPGVKGHDGSGQRHNQAANHQMLFSGEVKAARRVPNEADLQWAYLRFLPTLNNPLIGATARRVADGQNSLRIIAL
jgi:hypothetical protein